MGLLIKYWRLTGLQRFVSIIHVLLIQYGAWRSLVACLVRDQEAVGSNPVAPTTDIKGNPKLDSLYFFTQYDQLYDQRPFLAIFKWQEWPLRDNLVKSHLFGIGYARCNQIQFFCICNLNSSICSRTIGFTL